MANRPKRKRKDAHSAGSADAVEMRVVLRSVSWAIASVAGWLVGIRDEVDQFGGSEAVGDLLSASQVLSATADEAESLGIDFPVPMPPGVQHVTPQEFLEEKQNGTAVTVQGDEFPF